MLDENASGWLSNRWPATAAPSAGLAADQALQDWVRDSLPKGMAFAVSLLQNADLAEDVVHDCFYRLLSRRDCYDLPKDGMKLLHRSISNACIDYRRRARSLSGALDDLTPKSVAWSVRDRQTMAPPDEAMRRELEEAIAAALEGLPANQRIALQLKSMDLSLSEIADTLAVSRNHAGVLIHRARQQMRIALEPILGKS